MRTKQENGNKRRMSRRGIIYMSAILAVMIAAVILTVCYVKHKQTELYNYRNEALEELIARRGEYDENRIILAGTSEHKARALAEKLNADIRITKDGKFASLILPENTTILDVYSSDEYLKDIAAMSADYKVKTSDISLSEEEISKERIPIRPQYSVTDSAYSLQTYLDYINMKNVWNFTRGSGVTVAVIDTGIDTDHPEFAGRISEYSYNATEDKIVKDYILEDGSYNWELIEDEQGHGTAVAGVIGASMNDGAVVGIAPDATLLVIKAECDEDGKFKRTSDLVFGLYYAIERDASVVNMSFGTDDDAHNPFASATRLAYDSDIICVAAAGNNSTARLCYPAADELVFGIGALEADGWGLADYSNYGENTDFVAPGTVYTTIKGGGYGTESGTSFASPVAAGVLALYISQNQYQEFNTIQEMLYASCYDLGDSGRDWYYGYGVLDVSALILEERGTVTFNMLTDELDNTKQVFIRNHTLQNIPEPERLYAVFDGWYYDSQCTDEYDWYSDKFISDLTLYANWVNEEDGIPYTYVELEDGTIEIRSYTGHRRYLTIPDYIDGKKVTSIGFRAFAGQTKIREINLPKYLVHIRDEAFKSCNNLLNIYIPDTVTDIGASAFYDNTSLSYVAFGSNSGLKSIGGFAFRGCVNLTRFEVPEELISMDGSAFYGAISMTAFSVRKYNTAFIAKDGILFNNTGSMIICFPAGLRGKYTVPDDVHTIGICAFSYSKITQIEFSQTKEIHDSAFAYSSLKSLVIPDSVVYVGTAGFEKNYSLKSIKIGSGLKYISEYTFRNCEFLEDIYIPNNIESINASAFYENSSLKMVSFAPDSKISCICKKAFSGCSQLQSIEIPASVIVIEDDAFLADSKLSSVKFAENSKLQIIGAEAFRYNEYLTEIILPESLCTLGVQAFAESGLNTVTIPDAVTTIGAGAFASCHSLTEIKVSKNNARYLDLDGVVYDKEMTTLIEYPAGNLNESYTVANGVTAIGKAAFYGSWNLANVTLSNNVGTVDEYAFYDCISVREYILPEALTYIKRYAFASNSLLQRMHMPDNVIQISNYAFQGDWSLSSVTFTENSNLPRISYGAFAYCGLSSFRVPANVSTMAQGAFEGCTNLTSFTFAQNSKLESISAYMFDGCDNLETITFESGSALASIQAHGLEGMRKLVSIDFGDAKLTNIDNFAFRFCESLNNFTIPSGVTTVGRYAFYYCTGLQKVIIPESVEFIGRFAFLGTNDINVYFSGETLPQYLAEDWDHGVKGYYLGITDVVTEGDWQYAKLTSGNIAVIKYTGNETSINMTNLNFGGNIVNIGGGAFEYSSVESIKLPESLVTIQARAFYHSALKSISIPASVEFIGREAYADTQIQTLIFVEGAKLTVIEQAAFENTKQLQSVRLPASLNQTGRAIFKNSGIRTLSFADGFCLTEISEEAFAYTNITSLKLPESVSVIGHSAFCGTANLESVTFGSASDITLGSNVFYRSGLKTLTVPANMSYIGEYSLVGLSELTEFKVSENNPNYIAVNGLLVSKNGRKLIAVPSGRTGSFTVPAGIEVIGFGAFEDSKLSEVLFLDDANILSLGYRAFFGMKNIKEIRIPSSVVAIDYYAFANCTALEKVEFSEDNLLRGIYEGAFYGCKNLNEITLPDSIIEISDFAFYGCRKLTKLPLSDTGIGTLKGIYSYAMAYTGLTELKLPKSVIDVDSYAFKGAKLKSVVIPDGNAEQLIIGIGAFSDCYEMTEITLPFIGASFEDEEITWFGYIFGAGGEAANKTYVPESLKKVIITDGITSIGSYAFSGLNSLEEISVPHSVTVLYPYAFDGTTAKYELTNKIMTIISLWNGAIDYSADSSNFGKGISGHLELSYGVTSIGDFAFSGCDSLTNITIPESVKSIGDYVFSGCSRLTNLTIPDSVTTIGWNSFKNCSALSCVIIGNSVTSIGDSAFSGCRGLASITIPDSIISIGTWAFEDCSSLTSITIPGSVTSIGDSAFSGCSGLTSITVPDGVTSIGDFAFSGCSSLTSITIPGSVTSIDNYAFSGCSSLTSIAVPDSVTSIGDSAFSYCSSLTSITVPDSVTSIGGSAFSDCSSLMSITIPCSVTNIGEEAFWGCDKLYIIYNNSNLRFSIGGDDYGRIAGSAKIIVDKNGNKIYREDISGFEYIDTFNGFRFAKENDVYKLTAYLGSEDTVTLPTDINGNSYIIEHMKGVRNVIIPDGATSIDSGAFYGCDSLMSIKISDSVTSIGSWAFESCINLRSVTIGNGVTSIGAWAFEGCSSLTSIMIPDSVTSIGTWAFNDCINLKSVTIGKGLKQIGSQTFNSCPIFNVKISDQNANFTCIDGVLYNKDVTSVIFVFDGIKEVHFPASVTDIAGACQGKTEIEFITFAQGSRLMYICDYAFSGCSSLKSIAIPNGITNIGYGVFGGCNCLTSVTIPDSVTSIGAWAFEGCSILTSITIPDSVTSIGERAFSGCSSLKNIAIPNGVTNIGDAAFSSCNSITSITIPDSVTSIGDSLFYDCSSLTNITIPDSVTSIGEHAFHHCSNLMSITIPYGVTKIENDAFNDCYILYAIYNNSDLNFTIGSNDYGSIAGYAKLIVDKNGNRIYRDGKYGLEYIDTPDAFLFEKENGEYKLIAYLGLEDTVTLPIDINGKSYIIEQMKGVRNVIIPDGVTNINSGAFSGCISLTSITIPDSVVSIGKHAFEHCSNLSSITIPDGVNVIDDYAFSGCSSLRNAIIGSNVMTIGEQAFYGCDSLTSVTIRNNVTSIGSYAFRGCSSLTSITIPNNVTRIESGVFEHCVSLISIIIPDSVTSIGSYAFRGCSSLTSITIPDNVTRIGVGVFDNTAYYNNSDNWENGILFIGNHLIRVSEYAKFAVSRSGSIAYDAFDSSYMLKKLTIGGEHQSVLSALTNLETLVITEMPANYISSYGLTSRTLKNIVVAEGVRINSDAFSGISGITIYVEANEKDVRWDENFPGWSNGNKVVYGDDWITADFYDETDTLISSEIFKNAQIIRQPYVASVLDDTYYYEFLGWDIDGDGIDDVIPATSRISISAHAVFGKEYKCVLKGHDYNDVVTPPTHSDKGYTTHTCTVCGESYVDSYVDKLAYVIGDLDGNASVDKDDAIHLLMYTFYPEDYQVNQACDFDGNGSIDKDDAIYLLMYTFYPEDYPLPAVQ